MSWKSPVWVLLASLAAAGAASGVVETDVLDYEVRLPDRQIAPTYTFPTDQQSLALLPALASFQAAEGSGWKVLQWNPQRNTPSSLGGPAIPLVASGATEEQIRARVEAFVAAREDLFRVQMADLIFSDLVDLGGERSYVIFNQIHEGMEVIDGRLDVALWKGQVVLVGSEFYQEVQVDPFPRVNLSEAIQAAHLGIPHAAGDGAQGTPRLVVLPIHGEGGVVYHLAWEIYLRTHDPENVWRTYVDAHDSQVLWRQSEYAFFDLYGKVEAMVEPNTIGDVQEQLPLDDERVRANNTTVYTNEVGDYTLSVPNNTTYSITADLYGRYCNVNNQGGADASITQNGSPAAPTNFLYTDSNSDLAERDAYYHVNVVHDWIKGIDNTFTGLDYTMSANVNINSTCNAFWNGSSVNFYRAGDGCGNTGRISDVVYHEYGHGITQHIYSPNAPPTGSGMGEGFSDIDAMSIHNDPEVGEYFYNNGAPIRTGENTREYPGSECGGQVHCLGEIIMGAMWKTRVNFNVKYGEGVTPTLYDPLYIAARKTKQTSQPNFLNRLLMANDTDGNLANGTTDWYEICDAFAIHNLPCPPLTNYVTVTSDPIDDQSSPTAGYAVTAIVTSVGGGAIDPNGVKIFWTLDPIDGSATWNTAPMAPTGNPGEWAGEIPHQDCNEEVKYYVRAQKLTGEFATAPHLAPYRDYYNFMTGPFTIVLNDNLETDQGWTIGWAGDTADQGIWERVDPTGKYSGTYGATQPEDDHTAAGTLCFVTDGRGGAWSSYDVDNGPTTLVSPVYNWSGVTGWASIRFWSFFFDFTPTDDGFRWSISNDNGTTWTDLGEVRGMGWNDWFFQKSYITSDQLPFTNQMRFRLQMEDVGTQTACAEAAVDDIDIRFAQCMAADVGDQEIRPAALVVGQNTPNPFGPSTSIRFGLPAGGKAVVEVFDAGGRRVRTLADGAYPAGFHTLVWDGRDDSGHPAGSGVYYYSVTAGGESSGRKMMLLK